MRHFLIAALALSMSLAAIQPLSAEVLQGSGGQGTPGSGLKAGEQPSTASNPDFEIAPIVKQRAQVTRQLEAEQEASLLRLLDQLVGAGKSLVRVKMDLDFSRRTVHNQLKAPVTLGGKSVPNDRTVSPDKGSHETTAFNVEDSTVAIGPGNLKRLSVAVVLPTDVTDVAMAGLRRLIATAAGADAARRDQVTVEKFKLATPPAM